MIRRPPKFETANLTTLRPPDRSCRLDRLSVAERVADPPEATGLPCNSPTGRARPSVAKPFVHPSSPARQWAPDPKWTLQHGLGMRWSVKIRATHEIVTSWTPELALFIVQFMAATRAPFPILPGNIRARLGFGGDGRGGWNGGWPGFWLFWHGRERSGFRAVRVRCLGDIAGFRRRHAGILKSAIGFVKSEVRKGEVPE